MKSLHIDNLKSRSFFTLIRGLISSVKFLIGTFAVLISIGKAFRQSYLQIPNFVRVTNIPEDIDLTRVSNSALAVTTGLRLFVKVFVGSVFSVDEFSAEHSVFLIMATEFWKYNFWKRAKSFASSRFCISCFTVATRFNLFSIICWEFIADVANDSIKKPILPSRFASDSW